LGAKGLKQGSELEFAAFHTDKFDGSTYEILVGWNQIKPFYLGVENNSFEWQLKSEGIVERPAGRVLGKADAARRIALWVTIDDEGLLLLCGERCAEVYGRCCLANTTLLVGNGYNSTQTGPQKRNLAQSIRRLANKSRCFTWNVSFAELNYTQRCST